MQIFFGLAHVGPLRDELCRHTDRQVGRQGQIRQMKCRIRLSGRQLPQQRRQGIARLAQLLLQWRQRGRGLRFGCLLSQ